MKDRVDRVLSTIELPDDVSRRNADGTHLQDLTLLRIGEGSVRHTEVVGEPSG